MKKIITTLIIFISCAAIFAQERKVISDCTVVFSITSEPSGETYIGSKTVYIKGKDIRIDLVSKTFTQIIFFNSDEGKTTVLKNIGQSKYVAYYNLEQWKEANKIYSGATVSIIDTTKNILGYNCKKAILTLKNGTVCTIYYVPGLIPSAIDVPYELKNVPGFVLEYESVTKNNRKIKFTAEKIDFKPVASQKFNISTAGYRILHTN